MYNFIVALYYQVVFPLPVMTSVTGHGQILIVHYARIVHVIRLEQQNGGEKRLTIHSFDRTECEVDSKPHLMEQEHSHEMSS